jgi:acetyl esterase/lipase
MLRRCLLLAIALVIPAFAHAQPAKKKDDSPRPATQPLWPDGAPGAQGKEAGDIPGIMVYPAPAEIATGTAIVVCPGGGYGALAMDHEGHQIAQWLNKNGIFAVVVKYRLGPKYRYPSQLHDAQRAIRHVRHHASDWKIDPQKVGILGFSAGGHLTSTVLTQFDKGNPEAKDPIDRQSSRPDFGVLMYPVITLTGPYAHGGSRNNLLGKDADPQLIDSLCNEKRVTKETPPTFLIHTSEDTAVPPENSVLFYMALQKHKVPAEMHIYEKGRHGLGLGPADLPYSSWPDRCLAWLTNRGFLKKQ